MNSAKRGGAARPAKSTVAAKARARAIIAEASGHFPVGNQWGVVGFDYGPRVVGGAPSGDDTLRLYVQRKSATRTVPPLTWRGETIRPDIVAVGHSVRGALTTEGQFTGVHAGGTILVTSGASFAFGGIGAVLGKDCGSATHLLTAGHLFPLGASHTPVFCAPSPFLPPRQIGELATNFLDLAPSELGFALDLALVALNGEGKHLASLPVPKAPLPSRVAALDTIEDTPSQAYLATSNAYSNSSNATLRDGVFHVTSPPFRPFSYEVTNVVVTDHSLTAPGDSGTILLDANDHVTALGTCIGSSGRSSHFEPLERGFAALDGAGNPNLDFYLPPELVEADPR